MKNSLLLATLVVVVLGCDISRFLKNDNSGTGKPAPTVETKPSPANSPKPEATPKPSVTALLKKSVGKYPYQIKLLDNAELKDRLKKMLGKDFPDLKAHWNVESPIEIQDGIFRASGCEAHNCGSNMYLMFIDLKADNINVFHIEDAGTNHYYEGGEIALPKKFADELVTEN